MTAAPNKDLPARLEAARADYAKTHCNGDVVAAYSKVAELALREGFEGGAVTLEKLADNPELAERVIEKIIALTVAPATSAGTLSVPLPQRGITLRKTRNGLIPDEENIRRIVLNDPNLQGVVRYDEFSGDMILVRPITTDPTLVGERGVPRPWTDADTVVLQTYIQRNFIPRIGREKIEAVMAMHARHSCAVHPVRDYLQSVSWDRVPRLDTWLRDYLGANSQPEEYLAAVGAKWLISGVARIFEPGCQADNALVLEGAQGIYKSKALRTLASDDWFSDSLPADLSCKDARDHLRGKHILELPELAQFKRGEIETVKAFITRRFEQYRPSYGRHEIKFPRQCIFAGSTNDKRYLTDPTGNRRWWAIACSRVEIDAIKEFRDQFWAEAVTRYRAHEQWYLTPKLEGLAAAEAKSRVAHDPWTAKVADIVMQIQTPDVTPGEVMAQMDLQQSERHARNSGRIGTILGDLGWQEGKRHYVRGQTYLPPPGVKEDREKSREAEEKAFADPQPEPARKSTPAEPSARKTAQPADAPPTEQPQAWVEAVDAAVNVAPQPSTPTPEKSNDAQPEAVKTNGSSAHAEPAPTSTARFDFEILWPSRAAADQRKIFTTKYPGSGIKPLGCVVRGLTAAQVAEVQALAKAHGARAVPA
jgi:predicted P-loop ATPase